MIKAKVSPLNYAEAIQSAVGMGQTLEIWATDAIAHHIYRCEQIQAQQRYYADVREAERKNNPTPDKNEARYQVNRTKPTITQPAAGQGSDTHYSWRQYRP